MFEGMAGGACPGEIDGLLNVKCGARSRTFMAFAEELRERMDATMGMICRGLDVTPPQLMIIMYLSHRGPASVGDVVRDMKLNQGNTSATCKKLEQAGLIKRKRKLEDERIVTLSLERKGEAVAEKAARKFDQMDEIVESCPQQEIEPILAGIECSMRLFKKISEMLEKQA